MRDFGVLRVLVRDYSDQAEGRIVTARKRGVNALGQVLCCFLMAFYPLIRVVRMALDELRHCAGSRGCAKSQSAQEGLGIVEKITRECHVIELIEG